jgi:hypothetical protein
LIPISCGKGFLAAAFFFRFACKAFLFKPFLLCNNECFNICLNLF